MTCHNAYTGLQWFLKFDMSQCLHWSAMVSEIWHVTMPTLVCNGFWKLTCHNAYTGLQWFLKFYMSQCLCCSAMALRSIQNIFLKHLFRCDSISTRHIHWSVTIYVRWITFEFYRNIYVSHNIVYDGSFLKSLEIDMSVTIYVWWIIFKNI